MKRDRMATKKKATTKTPAALDVASGQAELMGMAASLEGMIRRMRELIRACSSTPECKASQRELYSMDPHSGHHVPFKVGRVRQISSIPWEIRSALSVALEDLPEVLKYVKGAARADVRTCRQTNAAEYAGELRSHERKRAAEARYVAAGRKMRAFLRRSQRAVDREINSRPRMKARTSTTRRSL